VPPSSPLRTRRLRVLLAVALVVLALPVLGLVLARSQLEARLHARTERMLAGSPFRVTWAGLDVSLLGQLTLRDVRLLEGQTPLASVGVVQARVAFTDLLRGKARAAHVLIGAPVLRLDVTDGKPAAWLRLRETIRLNRVQTDEPSTHEGLRRYFDTLAVQGGALHVRILGKLALLGADLDVTGLTGELELDRPRSSLTARTAGSFGASTLTVQVDVDPTAAMPIGADVAADPPLRVLPTLLNQGFLHGMTVAAAGLHATPEVVAVRQVTASGEVAVRIASVALHLADKTLRVEDLHAEVPTALLARRLPPNLASLLGSSPMPVTVHAATLVAPEGQPVNVELRGVQAQVLDVQASVATVRVQAPPGRLGKPLEWQKVRLEAPVLQVPRASVLWQQAPEVVARLDRLVALRKPAEPEVEVEDEEPDPTLAPPVHVAAPVGVVKERPSAKWIRAIQAGHAKILRTYAKLESAWRLDGVPGPLDLSVTGGRVVVTGPHGTPLLGVAEAELSLPPASSGPRPLRVHMQPFDSVGPWGRLGLTWQRDAATHAHQLDVVLSGGGMAQLIAARIPGMHLGGSKGDTTADVNLRATARLPDAAHLEVEGRVELDRMGIDWWRLSAQPIADFRASGLFQLSVGKSPASLTLRVTDATVGGNPAEGDPGARMEATVDVTHIDTHPKVDLQVGAPMQDCRTMLHAIPPSLTPTVGRVDAHGVMDWHVAVRVPMQSVGAVQVDLALGDTLCTFEGFPNLDLTELSGDFDRPVNENGKILDDVHIGPGSGSWTPLERIPQFVSYAMWSTEDSFYKHRGISEPLLNKALAIDLSTGRFTYGGSTITQQLVKNLYLKRHKALSRKFEEMLIVWQMEKIVGKRRILEIYINGVEFGPKVYGITRAAWAFFQKTPDQLLPEEGVYLAVIKPSPRSGYGTMRGNGWGDWYAEKSGKYMDKLLAEGSISPAAYQAAAAREFKPMFNPPAKGSTPAKAPGKGKHP
jgi:hypothetical protein